MESIVMYNSDDQNSGADENSRDAVVSWPKTLGDKLHADHACSGNVVDTKNDQTSGGTDNEAMRMDMSEKKKNGVPYDREKQRTKDQERTCKEDRDSKNNKRKKEKERDKNRDRDRDRGHYYDKDREHSRDKKQNFRSHSRRLTDDHRSNKSNNRDRERDREQAKHRERSSKDYWKNERSDRRRRTSESPQRPMCTKYDRQSEASSRDRNTSMATTPACDTSLKTQNSNDGSCEESSFSNGGQLTASTSNEFSLPLNGNTKTDGATFQNHQNNPTRYTERAQKRKLLWSHKKPEDTPNKWGNAKFAQDTDGKVASKFMRLMGIKSTSPKSDVVHTNLNSGANTESIKKREEMFSSMEQQYELARQVTHTMRGVGLGFNSQPRQF